jgi:outer membrane protein assembly factor BamB
LPNKLPEKFEIVWQKKLAGVNGLAGIAATREYVVLADRDELDSGDLFQCFAAKDGKLLWEIIYPAPGDLDYGNSPRATPLIHEKQVFLFGAFGHLTCVNLADGEIVWECELPIEFDVELPTWGYCASPLIVGDKIIVNPGAKDASLAALDIKDGNIAWQTPGRGVAYGSFLLAKFSDRQQIVGRDALMLGAWDPQNGQLIWELKLPQREEFGVPTPIQYGNKLIVADENNGTRIFGFDAQGKIIAEPEASNVDLAPDTSTPIIVADRIYGCWDKLFCLDTKQQLKSVWSSDDAAFAHHVTLIGGRERVLLLGNRGELILLDVAGDEPRIVSRSNQFAEREETYSHPAIAGRKMYLRVGRTLYCANLE